MSKFCLTQTPGPLNTQKHSTAKTGRGHRHSIIFSSPSRALRLQWMTRLYQKNDAALARGRLFGDLRGSFLRWEVGVLKGLLAGSVVGAFVRSADPGNLLTPGGVRTSGDRGGSAQRPEHRISIIDE